MTVVCGPTRIYTHGKYHICLAYNENQPTTVTLYIIAIAETEAAVTSKDLFRGHGQDGQI